MDNVELDEWLKEQLDSMRAQLNAKATNNRCDEKTYVETRERLVKSKLAPLLPPWLKKCRFPSDFWPFISKQASTWAERRAIITDALAPAYEALERGQPPVADLAAQMLSGMASEHVQDLWAKALGRRLEDPAGAITAARSLLESVAKHILDDLHIEYSPKADLPALYRAVSNALSLAPSQHTEESFKVILGGCTAVVGGLANLRNVHGDAHGQGRRSFRPAARHAELAVNLAGSLAAFMIATHEARRAGDPKS